MERVLKSSCHRDASYSVQSGLSNYSKLWKENSGNLISDRLTEGFFNLLRFSVKQNSLTICYEQLLSVTLPPFFFSQMNPIWLNLVMQLMLLYLPPWMFGSSAFQRQFPVSFVVWFLQAFASLDHHHLCEKYLKPMNHHLLLSALFCSCVMMVVMFLKYTHYPSVCMETKPSSFLLLQYCSASFHLLCLASKWYSEQTCSTFSECTVKGGKLIIDIFN